MSTNYELLYFPLRGRAEIIRLVFAAANVSFTNTGVTNWPEFKSKTPLGQMPVLVERDENGERMIPQTMAIVRHLARAFDLYGRDELERTRADVVAETMQDWRGRFAPVLFKQFMNTPEDVVAKYWADLPGMAKLIEGLLPEGTGFFVGDKLTYADLLVFDTVDSHIGLDAGCLKDFPRLIAFHDRVKSVESMKAYLDKRG